MKHKELRKISKEGLTQIQGGCICGDLLKALANVVKDLLNPRL